MASIEIPFAVGETVWHPASRQDDEYETCPECLGTRVLTIILGDESRVTVDCGGCRRGYDGSLGVVKTRTTRFAPRQVAIARVTDIRDGEVFYTDAPEGAGCYQIYSSARLYKTREECERRCAELDEENAATARRIVLHNITNGRADQSFSVAYWRKKVRDLEQQLEMARGKLAVAATPRAGSER